ncbi:MAG TPA: VOC family protein, partial [Blastocatellia bacterium]|nr:VOC family protein [Blastocatellia bacterium]
DDIEEAKKFYGVVLGLKKVFEMPGWAMFSHSDQGPSIGLSADPRHNNQTGAVVVLRVDNINSAKKELSRSGIEFESEEEVPGVVRLAMFRDNSGNQLQLMQRLIQG